MPSWYDLRDIAGKKINCMEGECLDDCSALAAECQPTRGCVRLGRIGCSHMILMQIARDRRHACIRGLCLGNSGKFCANIYV